jgi:putative transposase
MVIDFKRAHCPKAMIVHAVFFYVRYAVSYRDLGQILAERGVSVDHANLHRWGVKYSPLIATKAQAKKRPTAVSWRMPSRDIAVQCPAG